MERQKLNRPRNAAFRHTLLVSMLVLAVAAGGAAQSPPAKPTPAPRVTPDVIALGKALFSDRSLSSTGTISCASCHDPEQSFADGQTLAKGQLNTLLSRNTPTLFGAASIARFPNPKGLSRGADQDAALTLGQRCLSPLENEQEMGRSLDEAVARAARNPSLQTQFDRAFDPPFGGATAERMGQALDAYVRSLELPPSPWRDFLEGRTAAMTANERDGHTLFIGKARCDSCHSGPVLTDGLMHVVKVPTFIASGEAEIPPRPVTKVAARANAGQKQQGIIAGYGGGGFAPSQDFERQSPPLVDLGRTAPYFRDGSAATLSDAVEQHVNALRLIDRRRVELARVLGSATFGAQKPGQGAADLRPAPIPEKQRLSTLDRKDTLVAAGLALQPDLDTDRWVPPDLTTNELADLVAFLSATSPR